MRGSRPIGIHCPNGHLWADTIYYEKAYPSRRRCRVCRSAQRSAGARKQKLRAKYGLTLTQYDELLKEQNGVCAICGEGPKAGRSWLDVDHCHKTGSVRGLLCNPCNTSIGRFEDDPERLEAAASYLRRNRT